MSRIHEIRARLSALPLCGEHGRHIIYLVTEDRDILEEVFAGASANLKDLCPRAFAECRAAPEKFYRYALSRGRLVDLYPRLPGQPNLFPLPAKQDGPVGAPLEAFFYLCDFHILDSRGAAHLLKQFISCARTQAAHGCPVYLFLIAPVLRLPDGFQDEVEVIDVPELDHEDLLGLLHREAAADGTPFPDTPLDQERLEAAARDFKGLSRHEVLKITKMLHDACGCFYGRSDRPCGSMDKWQELCALRAGLTQESKQQAARCDSTVTLLEPADSVAGMEVYCDWLAEIRDDLLHPESALHWGTRPPRGVLLTGIPGSGKTQAAKKTACEMGVSLVQIRMENLLGGLVGDSEANFKRCRKRVEALAPCVVLIDELEKIFGIGEGAGSHEVKLNLLAALLDWLQENRKPIFFFATSNSVGQLRPELLRGGRFDMRYCVFMPTHDELLDIFCLHLRKADALSGGRLFRGFADEFSGLAQDFLEQCSRLEKDLFYTGADVESLIQETNRRLRSRSAQGAAAGLTRGAYLQALLESVESGRSQPYGVTNLPDIAGFWLSALQNRYTMASRENLFRFEAFDRETGELRQPQLQSNYDRQLFSCVSAEIRRQYQAHRKW